MSAFAKAAKRAGHAVAQLLRVVAALRLYRATHTLPVKLSVVAELASGVNERANAFCPVRVTLLKSQCFVVLPPEACEMPTRM